MWFGASAAASPSVLASLAPRQCGVGGRMLGSNLNTISLDDTKNTKTKKTKTLATFSNYRKQASRLSIDLRWLLDPSPHIADERSSVCFTDQFKLN